MLQFLTWNLGENILLFHWVTRFTFWSSDSFFTDIANSILILQLLQPKKLTQEPWLICAISNTAKRQWHVYYLSPQDGTTLKFAYVVPPRTSFVCTEWGVCVVSIECVCEQLCVIWYSSYPLATLWNKMKDGDKAARSLGIRLAVNLNEWANHDKRDRAEP